MDGNRIDRPLHDQIIMNDSPNMWAAFLQELSSFSPPLLSRLFQSKLDTKHDGWYIGVGVMFEN